ncbi:hypothetical protein [Spirosoma sp. KUDC1026]|uniref:hypothetical protein n=1 Tax=Spirosoma sp. KUDC1026 TaxID=2745947 RepID=UPI00159B9DDF|nr:hypothetical protein [Spirosoma sp. KUDC1026]QKZ13775.1 hypothetical protein HU175_14510 [Spirosoma sp. KUDC1026]
MNYLKTKKVVDAKANRTFVVEELEKIFNIELLLVRGQILIEYVFTSFIENYSTEDDYRLDDKFPFYSKFQICRLLGLYTEKDTALIEQINVINKMRNDIAHKLTFDRTLLPNLYKHHNGLKQEVKKKKLKGEAKDRYMLVMIFGSLCGNFSGRAAAVNTVHNTISDFVLGKTVGSGRNFAEILQQDIADLKLAISQE